MAFKIFTDKQGSFDSYDDATYTFNEAGYLVIHTDDGRRITLSAVAWFAIEEPPPDKAEHIW